MMRSNEVSEPVRLALIETATRLTEKHVEMKEQHIKEFPETFKEHGIEAALLALHHPSQMAELFENFLGQLETRWLRHTRQNHDPLDT